VKTYSPEGLTPVIYDKQTHDHLSVMGGLTPSSKVYTLARQESLNGLHSVAFLRHLLRVAGARLLVIWDARQDMAGSAAGICPGSEPLGRRKLAAPQACGDAQPGVPGRGRNLAFGGFCGLPRSKALWDRLAGEGLLDVLIAMEASAT
jgi:hypothetical protein